MAKLSKKLRSKAQLQFNEMIRSYAALLGIPTMVQGMQPAELIFQATPGV